MREGERVEKKLKSLRGGGRGGGRREGFLRHSLTNKWLGKLRQEKRRG